MGHHPFCSRPELVPALLEGPRLFLQKNKKGTQDRALLQKHLIAKRSRFYFFEKLATATASVSKTSNTVSSFVICSTSWNFDPR